MKIHAATPNDATAIADIYAHFVAGSAITFETEIPDAEEMRRRMGASQGLYPWFVAVDDQGVVHGYAYATLFKSRNAYRFSVETSIYVAPRSHGKGTGRLLYGQLLETLARQGFVQAIASITLPNPASLKLHQQLGFREVGLHRQIGFKSGEWHDVAQWQRPLAPIAVPPAEPRKAAEVFALTTR